MTTYHPVRSASCRSLLVAQFVIGAIPVVYLIAVLAALVVVAVGVMEWRTSLARRSVS